MFVDLTTQFRDTRFDLGFRDHHFYSMFHNTNHLILNINHQSRCFRPTMTGKPSSIPAKIFGAGINKAIFVIPITLVKSYN